MRTREGFTLLEIVVVLALLGILLGVAAPPALRWLDEAAVRSAREEIAAALARTRMAAVAHGGASLHIAGATGRIWIEVADGTPVMPALDLTDRYGVTLETGSPAPIGIRYDGLGIGRVANRTVRVRRREAVDGLTISGYGRYRRW